MRPDIEPWLMTTSVALPAMGAGLPVELEAEADYGEGLMVLDGLTGTVNEGAVAGDINAAIKNGKPHLTGQLTLDELDLDPLAAMVLGEFVARKHRQRLVRGAVRAEGDGAVQRRARHYRGDARGRRRSRLPTTRA